MESHRSFSEAEALEFDLLADPDAELATAFDVDVRDGAAARTTFFLADGKSTPPTRTSTRTATPEVLREAFEEGIVSSPE